MRGLLIKDFKLTKSQKNFLFLMVVIAAFTSFSFENTSFAVGYLGVIGSIFALSSISYDEFDNGHAFLFSLPITRKVYVQEKYLFGLITGGTLWILGTVIYMIASVVKQTGTMKEILISSFAMLLVVILMLAFTLPFHLKYGGEKGRIMIIAAAGIITIIVFGATKIGSYFHLDPGDLMAKLSSINPEIVLILALLAAGLILFISLQISIRIMEHKEF